MKFRNLSLLVFPCTPRNPINLDSFPVWDFDSLQEIDEMAIPSNSIIGLLDNSKNFPIETTVDFGYLEKEPFFTVLLSF